MKKILKYIPRLPYTIGCIIAAVVLISVFGLRPMAEEITSSVKAGLEKDLISVQKKKENAVAAVPAAPPANSANNAGTAAGSASGQAGDAAGQAGAGTADAGAAADGSADESTSADTAAGAQPAPAAPRGTCQYVYDGSLNTGDPDHDLILASENYPEAYSGNLDQFGNVLPGAATPEGTFSYNPAEGVNTAFLSYPATQVNSGYYQDPGWYTFTTAANYVSVDDSYFNDALFIGDSRTVGLFDYGQLPADFFCDRGYCTYDYVKGKQAILQNTGAKMTLDQCLAAKQYGKIYIILGINDSGYGSREAFVLRYQQMLNTVRMYEPSALIYVCANMYFATTFTDKLGVMNNVAVRDKNFTIAGFADGSNIFYLNYNGMFTDGAGNLRPTLTTDGAHLMGRYYAQWSMYFRHHAVGR